MYASTTEDDMDVSSFTKSSSEYDGSDCNTWREEPWTRDPAPSPSAVPMTVKFGQPNDVVKAKTTTNSDAMTVMCGQLDAGDIPPVLTHVAVPMMTRVVASKKDPLSKIASLQGALDESREHVSLLEGVLQKRNEEFDNL